MTEHQNKILYLFHQVNAMASTQYCGTGDYEAKVEALSCLLESDPQTEQLTGTEATCETSTK